MPKHRGAAVHRVLTSAALRVTVLRMNLLYKAFQQNFLDERHAPSGSRAVPPRFRLPPPRVRAAFPTCFQAYSRRIHHFLQGVDYSPQGALPFSFPSPDVTPDVYIFRGFPKTSIFGKAILDLYKKAV
jgi:hypothetical protein